MTPKQLEPVLQAVEPAVRVVSSRHLLKVLLYLRDHGHTIPANPDLPLWVSREELTNADVLPESVRAGTEPRLLLVTAPGDRNLDRLPPTDLLRAYWRLLFQASIQATLDQKFPIRTKALADSANRLTRFGPAAAREIRFVLESDHLVSPEADDAEIYRAFAATYLDRVHFSPAAPEEFFPSLPAPAEVVAVLAKDVDGLALLARTRPAGAADPEHETPAGERWGATEDEVSTIGIAAPVALEREAERKGNFVRAAILAVRSEDFAAARSTLSQFVRKLAEVLIWDEPTCHEWEQSLAALLQPAAVGYWPHAARCLYELQKIPADLGREVYAVDAVAVLRSFGRRPIKRPLPHARNVRLLVQLHAARKQLHQSRLTEGALLRLDRLFHHETHRIEHTIRTTLTPILTDALTASGFRPANRVEEVARDKAVAELLDHLCERGQLRFGDLRDAIARNQLKMPDLTGPVEFVTGDPLLRADIRLTYDLDGIYHRGELYLRAIQRGSSLFFGTPVGRFLTLYLIGPLLASFLTLMAAEEFRHIGGKLVAFASRILAPHPTPELQLGWDADTGELVWFDTEQAAQLATEAFTSSAETHGSFLIAWPTVLGLAVFLLLVFHVPPFRRAVAVVGERAWRTLRWVLWDLPRALLSSPLILRIRYNPAMRFVSRRFGGAFLLTAGVLVVLAFLGAAPDRLARWGGSVFAVAAVLFNTPLGWELQEQLAKDVSDAWRIVRVNLLPGLLLAIIDGFRRLANWVERRLYAVDEWLRFRSGDSHGSFVAKAILGLLWFPVAYLARFTFYLLVEPQINPVKHFPVVTVSHKVILPMTPSLAAALNISDATAAGLLACIPGMFGFIAWELMANWRLYRANRPLRLRPVMIGSHGETMRGLLRPGFHSGTVPRLFRRLRAADREGKRHTAAKYHHDLDHAAEAVRRFSERELAARLEHCAAWGKLPLEVADVRFGCRRAVITMERPDRNESGLVVTFEYRGERIEGTVRWPGWLEKLTAGQRAALIAAMRGLFDMAATESFDDRERDTDTHRGAGIAGELARPFTWAEWVARWEELDSAKQP